MIFVPCVLLNRVIDESVQLDTTTLPPIISTPSNPPAPLAMTLGARSPGFHARGGYCSCQISTRFPVKIGTSKRLRRASYPISAGLGTPLIDFVPCPFTYR